MPIVYSTATINARLNAVVSTIDAGAGNGILNVFTSSSALAVSITLAKPSGNVSNGVLVFLGVPLVGHTVANGTATSVNITDSNGNTVVSGLTVGNSSAFDVVMPITAITSGQLAALTFATIIGS